jgi:hypothetical protein
MARCRSAASNASARERGCGVQACGRQRSPRERRARSRACRRPGPWTVCSCRPGLHQGVESLIQSLTGYRTRPHVQQVSRAGQASRLMAHRVQQAEVGRLLGPHSCRQVFSRFLSSDEDASDGSWSSLGHLGDGGCARAFNRETGRVDHQLSFGLERHSEARQGVFTSPPDRPAPEPAHTLGLAV